MADINSAYHDWEKLEEEINTVENAIEESETPFDMVAVLPADMFRKMVRSFNEIVAHAEIMSNLLEDTEDE